MSEKVLISKSKLDMLSLSILQKAGLQGKKTLDELGVIIDEISEDAQGAEVEYIDTGEKVLISKSKLDTLANKILTKAGLEGPTNLDELTTIVKELSFETSTPPFAKFRVERVTTDSYVDSTTYTDDSIISLTVSYDDTIDEAIVVKYNGNIILNFSPDGSTSSTSDATKTIRIGKYMGVDDNTATEGVIEITGNCTGYGEAMHTYAKAGLKYLGCIKESVVLGGLKRVYAMTRCNFSNINNILHFEDIEYMVDGAFSGNTYIEELYLNNCTTLTTISGAGFYGCTNLRKIELPNSVTQLLQTSFCNCSNLVDITIPESVTSISNGVFKGCSSLTSIVIPSGVSSIVYELFSGCTNLKTITLLKSDAIVSLDTRATGGTAAEEEFIYGCTNLQHIIVPSNLLEAYKNNGFWSNYAQYLKASD